MSKTMRIIKPGDPIPPRATRIVLKPTSSDVIAQRTLEKLQQPRPKPVVMRIKFKRSNTPPTAAAAAEQYRKIILQPKKGNELFFNPDGTVALPLSEVLARRSLDKLHQNHPHRPY